MTKQGLAGIVATNGNPDCHVILRGGNNQPNYSAEHVDAAWKLLEKAKVPSKLISVDLFPVADKVNEKMM